MSNLVRRLNQVDTAASHGFAALMSPHRLASALATAVGLAPADAEAMAHEFAASGHEATFVEFGDWVRNLQAEESDS